MEASLFGHMSDQIPDYKLGKQEYISTTDFDFSLETPLFLPINNFTICLLDPGHTGFQPFV